MPGLHVVRRVGPAGELFVAEETLQLLLAQAHHAAHPRAPLLARPRHPGPFTKYQSHSMLLCCIAALLLHCCNISPLIHQSVKGTHKKSVENSTLGSQKKVEKAWSKMA